MSKINMRINFSVPVAKHFLCSSVETDPDNYLSTLTNVYSAVILDGVIKGATVKTDHMILGCETLTSDLHSTDLHAVDILLGLDHGLKYKVTYFKTYLFSNVSILECVKRVEHGITYLRLLVNGYTTPSDFCLRDVVGDTPRKIQASKEYVKKNSYYIEVPVSDYIISYDDEYNY